MRRFLHFVGVSLSPDCQVPQVLNRRNLSSLGLPKSRMCLHGARGVSGIFILGLIKASLAFNTARVVRSVHALPDMSEIKEVAF